MTDEELEEFMRSVNVLLWHARSNLEEIERRQRWILLLLFVSGLASLWAILLATGIVVIQ